MGDTRARVRFTLRKADKGDTLKVNGQPYKQAVIDMIVDGYTTPLTSGNFVDLVRKGFYDGMAIQRSDGFVVQTGDPDGPDGPLVGYGQDGDPKRTATSPARAVCGRGQGADLRRDDGGGLAGRLGHGVTVPGVRCAGHGAGRVRGRLGLLPILLVAVRLRSDAGGQEFAGRALRVFRVFGRGRGLSGGRAGGRRHRVRKGAGRGHRPLELCNLTPW